jgi:hypothetical protein
MLVRDTILQRLTDRIMRVRVVLEKFDDAGAERCRVGPKWNVRDLVGHFVYWDVEVAARLGEIAAGKPAPKYDFNKVNEEVYQKYRRMSYVMLLPQLRAAEEGLIAAVRAVPEKLLIDSPARDWIDDAAIAHYDHHWPSLRDVADRGH